MRPSLTPRLEVTHIEAALPSLPPALEGVFLAHVSDLHVGEGAWEPMRLAEAAEVLRTIAPAVSLNTGDYCWGQPELSRVIARAKTLAIASPTGVSGPVNLAVLGNHDYYAGPERVRDLADALATIGVRVLTNELVSVSVSGADIAFAGLDAHQAGLDEALAALLMSKPPRVVLIHEPDLAGHVPAGSAELILAGHTHGGQIRIPFLSEPIVLRFSGSRYAERGYRINGIPLYINRGLGCTGIPLRFRARPEITLLRLQRVDRPG